MKKLFLVFLILSVVFGFAQSVSADGEPGFSPTFKKVEKKPIGIINYEGLFIDLNINDIGDWKNPAKKWRKGYKRRGYPDHQAFYFPKKRSPATLNFHVLISDKNNKLSKGELLRLAEIEIFEWFKKTKGPSTKYGRITETILNGESQALFMETMTRLENGKSFQLSFMLTSYKDKEIFFIFVNNNSKAIKIKYNHSEDLKKIIPKIVFLDRPLGNIS